MKSNNKVLKLSERNYYFKKVAHIMCVLNGTFSTFIYLKSNWLLLWFLLMGPAINFERNFISHVCVCCSMVISIDCCWLVRLMVCIAICYGWIHPTSIHIDSRNKTFVQKRHYCKTQHTFAPRQCVFGLITYDCYKTHIASFIRIIFMDISDLIYIMLFS